MKKNIIIVKIVALLCIFSLSHNANTYTIPNATPTSSPTTKSKQPIRNTKQRVLTVAPSQNPTSTVVQQPVSPKIPPTSSLPDFDQLPTLDSIVTIVMNNEGTLIITQSDIERPSLSGAPRTLDDIVFELLVFLDATKHKIIPDDSAVDRYLETVLKDNNITRKELEELFAQSGYSFEQAREEFKKMQANNTMLHYEITSNLTVPRRKIEEYYQQHPETVETQYYLEYALVPIKTNISIEEQITAIKTSQVIPIPWSKPFWITKSELADNKSFIHTLSIGELSVQQNKDELEVYRLVDKKAEHLRTLEERYSEIASILRRPRYMELIKEYKEKLFATSSIQYL